MPEKKQKYLGESPEVFKARNVAFGMKLAKVRAKHLLSQDQLAEKVAAAGCPVERMTVSRLEQGKHGASLGVIMALAKVFPRDYRWLIDMDMPADRDYAEAGRENPADLDEAYRIVQRLGAEESMRRLLQTGEGFVRVSGPEPEGTPPHPKRR